MTRTQGRARCCTRSRMSLAVCRSRHRCSTALPTCARPSAVVRRLQPRALCVHVNCRSLLQACGGQELHGADGRAAVPKQHLRQHTVSTSTPIRIVDCRRSDDRSNQTNRIGSVLTTLGRRCVMEGRPMDEPPFLDTDLGEKSAPLLPPAIPPSAVLCEHSHPQRCNPSAADGADRLHQCAFLGRS